MRHTDEDDDADSSGVLRQPHADLAVKQRFPALSRGEEDCYKHGADCADNAVEEGCEGEASVSALELLNGFVKVDYAIQEREDFGREGCYIALCAIWDLVTWA